MRVIIQEQFFEFQNERTEDIFNEQKHYLAKVVKQSQETGDDEYLLTALLSLNNLTEALISQAVEERGLEDTLKLLKAKTL